MNAGIVELLYVDLGVQPLLHGGGDVGEVRWLRLAPADHADDEPDVAALERIEGMSDADMIAKLLWRASEHVVRHRCVMVA